MKLFVVVYLDFEAARVFYNVIVAVSRGLFGWITIVIRVFEVAVLLIYEYILGILLFDAHLVLGMRLVFLILNLLSDIANSRY